MDIAFLFFLKTLTKVVLQIFQPTDSQTEEDALKTVRTLVETIYTHEEEAIETEDDIQGLAKDVCDECIQVLREPEKSQAKPAIKVLCAFTNTTRPSAFRSSAQHFQYFTQPLFPVIHSREPFPTSSNSLRTRMRYPIASLCYFCLEILSTLHAIIKNKDWMLKVFF